MTMTTHETHIVLRYDDAQAEEIRVTAEDDGMVAISFGPAVPTDADVLTHVLRSRVTPPDGRAVDGHWRGHSPMTRGE